MAIGKFINTYYANRHVGLTEATRILQKLLLLKKYLLLLCSFMIIRGLKVDRASHCLFNCVQRIMMHLPHHCPTVYIYAFILSVFNTDGSTSWYIFPQSNATPWTSSIYNFFSIQTTMQLFWMLLQWTDINHQKNLWWSVYSIESRSL